MVLSPLSAGKPPLIPSPSFLGARGISNWQCTDQPLVRTWKLFDCSFMQFSPLWTLQVPTSDLGVINRALLEVLTHPSLLGKGLGSSPWQDRRTGHVLCFPGTLSSAMVSSTFLQKRSLEFCVGRKLDGSHGRMQKASTCFEMCCWVPY